MKHLLIRIVDIPETGISLNCDVPPDAFPILVEMKHTGECEFISSIKLSAITKAVGKTYCVSGTFDTDVRLICSRCLSEFEKPLKETFEMAFAPEEPGTVDNKDDQDKELTAEEIKMMYFDGEEIDLKDALQQQLIMNLSQKPLCKETCKGLCQKCGANLNEENCRCSKDQINSKFEMLKNLKLDK